MGPDHPLGDRPQILGPLPLGIDGLGEAVAQLAVEIQLGEAEIGVGELGEILQGVLRGPLAGGDRLEETLELIGIHDGREPRSAPPRR